MGGEKRELAAIQASDAKDCCKVADNLVRVVVSPGSVVNTCRVCGCRHFRLSAERGRGQ